MGREKEPSVLPWNEGRTTTMRKSLLWQGEALLKKAISLSRLKPVLSSKRTASDKLRDYHQRSKGTGINIPSVCPLLPFAWGKKIWLFKCSWMSRLLWRPVPKERKGFHFPFSPAPVTTFPEVDFCDRLPAIINFWAVHNSILKLNSGFTDFYIYIYIGYIETLHIVGAGENPWNYIYVCLLKRVSRTELCKRFLDRYFLLSMRKLVNLSTVWTQEHYFKHI